MSVPVTMPQLGESVTEGTVTRWLKKVGDTVIADEPLLEVSTDKVDTEIPAPASGVLLSISAPEDAVVAVGGELCVIGSADAAPAAAPAPTAPAPEPAAAAPAPAASAPVAPAAPAATPAPAATGGAATAVTIPALGESVTEGTITRWLKKVGDTVAADEPLLEISTDKVDTEIPAPASGVLLSISAPEDSVVAIGAEVAVIGAASAASVAPAPAAPAAPAPVPAAPAAPAAPAPVPAAPEPAPVAPAAPAPAAAPTDADSYVTPLVRKLAAERGVDLSTVTGTGVGGRIRKADILAAATAAPPAAPGAAGAAEPSGAAAQRAARRAAPEAAALRGTVAPMTRLRRVIAQRMMESLQQSAQLTTVVEVDLSRIVALRERIKTEFEAREGVRLTYLPFIAAATVEALVAYPQVNASVDAAAGTVTYHADVNLGIAVDTDRGLLVPVVRGAQDLNVPGLARRITDIAERTRTNKVSPDELSGGTFTITNTGSRGALFDTPIINQPQVAILGSGAIVKRPVVVTDPSGADLIAVRSMMYLALTYDHRLVDGADAARFLGAIKARLEEPGTVDWGA